MDQGFQSSTFDRYHFFNKKKKNDHFLKRTFQLVIISVSAFSSLFICYYSTGFSLFPQYSFNFYFSTFLFSLFTHTLERKYMFLICNGILAFLAKSSLSCNSSSSSPSVFVNAGGDHDEFSLSASEMSQMKEPVLVDEEVIIIPVTSSSSEEKQEQEQEKQERECLVGEKERESDQSGVIQEEEEEGDDDDDIGEAEAEAVPEAAGSGGGANEDISSTDELNRKIEEFIRKMKEEIRIEAQQQLITVE
ncbi:hypothetical protein ACOSP7_015880 [Xanthoceras sorbifolium]